MQATDRKKILGISGSTRQDSANHRLLNAIAALAAGRLEITFFDGLSNLPHFNPDNDTETVAAEVTRFKQHLHNADGVIICTPEYAHGVPGTLKNAIDWTVGSGGFSGKPTVLITASADGRFGHAALLETLRVIEAKHIDRLQLLIPFAKTKINHASEITDEKTRIEVKALIDHFITTLYET